MPSPIINIKFLADLKQFSTQMQSANRSLGKVGKKMQKVGAGLTAGLTLPLLGLGAVALKSFDQQAKAIAQVEAGLKSTGNQVGITSKGLQGIASDLQAITTFGDEEILKGVTSQLLTFTNIAGEQFKRTQVAALDLATRLDGDLKSASIQLGKALNDPVANLSALSRSGIQFSDSQKATISSLAKTNRLAEAQTIILNELEKQYGGSAEAAAKAGLGPFKQLGNILGDIGEELGAIIAQYLIPFVNRLKDLASGFSDLSPQTKKWIVILGGVAAAVGPLLALAGTILPAIGAGFAILTGPIGLIIAGLTAIGVIIYKNWAPIKQTLIDIANYFIDLYNESTIVRIGVEAITNTFKNLFEVGKFVFETLKNVIGGFIENVTNGFKTFGAVVKAALTGNFSEIPALLKANADQGKQVFSGFTDELANDWKNLTDGIKKNGQDAIAAITSRKKIAFIKADVDASGVSEAVSEATAQGIAKGLSTAGTGGVDTTPQVSALSSSLETADVVQIQSPLNNIVTQLPKQLALVDEGLAEWQSKLVDFEEQSGSIIESSAETFAAGFGNLIAGIVQGANPLQGFTKLILTTVGDMLQQLGKAAIQIGITMIGLKKAFASPLAAIAAGVAAIALGGIIKSFVPEGFANGGIVGGSSFYGDKILARVNSGELILNTQQQKSLYNQLNTPASIAESGGPLTLATKISGSDILLVAERETKKQNRRA